MWRHFIAQINGGRGGGWPEGRRNEQLFQTKPQRKTPNCVISYSKTILVKEDRLYL